MGRDDVGRKRQDVGKARKEGEYGEGSKVV